MVNGKKIRKKWYGMVYSAVLFGMVRCGTVRYGTVRRGGVGWGRMWYGMVWHGMHCMQLPSGGSKNPQKKQGGWRTAQAWLKHMLQPGHIRVGWQKVQASLKHKLLRFRASQTRA